MRKQDLRNATRIAWRYFFSPKSKHAVNILAIVSVLGITLVTIAMIVVLSVFNGFEVFTDSQLSRLSPSYKLVQKDRQPFSPEVVGISDCGRALEAEAIAYFENESLPVKVLGIDDHYMELLGFRRYIIDGAYDLGSSDVPTALIGIGVAMNLNAGAGYLSPIEIKLPKRVGRISTINPNRSFISQAYHISGVFRTDQEEDNTVVILPIKEVQNLLQMSNEIVSYLALEEKVTPPEGYLILDRYEQHPDIYKVFKLEKWFSFSLLIFVLLLSLCSIISTLAMLIIEKREDLKTLRNLGARSSIITAIPIIEGWLLSITGLVIGSIVGVILVLLQAKYGFVKLSGGNGDSFIIDAYPVDFRIADIVLVSLVILLLGFISSWTAHKIFSRKKQ